MSSRPRPGRAATRTGARRAERHVKPARLARFAGLLLAPVLAAGCSWIPGWLSEQEENDLVTHKRNSKAFLDVGDFARAEDQCRRGLAIDEDDETLELTLGYALLFQGQPQKLEEAATVFDNAIGSFGTDDWRLLAGQGMTLQQLARHRAASEDPKVQAEAAGLRARSRDSLDEAAEISGKTNNTPTDVLYHIALLDLEEGRADLFPEHAQAAFAKLQANEKFLSVKLDHPM